MLRAYVDESGDRSCSATASRFFVMTAAVMSDAERPAVQGRLGAIRHLLSKPPGTVLHFSENIRTHEQRVRVCQELASLTGLSLLSVVLCTQHVAPTAQLARDPQTVYLYTLRYTLERISWIARDRNEKVIITFAHVRRFPRQVMVDYLDLLRQISTQIKWEFIQDVRINQPGTLELLQVADVAAAAAAEVCKTAGLEFTTEQEDPAPGWRYRRLILRSPSGYRVALEGPNED